MRQKSKHPNRRSKHRHIKIMISPEYKFFNRQQAGQLLADKIKQSFPADQLRKAIVFALPRGGLPVAKPVADALNVPLDICLVRKLGTPRNPELAMGALASFGGGLSSESVAEVWNQEIRETVAPEMQDKVRQREMFELQRRNEMYRQQAEPVNLAQFDLIIIVDDGVATGATARAALLAARHLIDKQAELANEQDRETLRQRKRIVMAAPVMSPQAAEELQSLTSHVISCMTPTVFFGVGQFYRDFTQTTDAQVIDIIHASKQHSQ